MSTESEKEKREPRSRGRGLLEYLRRLKDDRGAMADLRCALIPAKVSRAWPLLARIGGIGDLTVETIAGMFAYHPIETQVGNLGTTCRGLYGATDGTDARFRRLLACGDRSEICEHLRSIVLAAKAKDIAVNYEQLFADIRYWGTQVKARWATEYWRSTEGAGDAVPGEDAQ